MPNRYQTNIKILRSWAIRGLLGVAVLAASLTITASHVTAQTTSVTWSAPEDLSNTPESSASPAIVADQFGNVHVFWSEDTSAGATRNPDLAGPGNTIYYSRWDGKSWTEPVDVLYVPNDSVATHPAATVDKNGYIHVVWTGLTNIYYSNAPAWQAESAGAWRSPTIIADDNARSEWESSTVVDNDGNVHIVYAAGGDPGVYHVESTDRGATWSLPTKLSYPMNGKETSFARVKAIVDGNNQLHAVWQTTDAQGFGQGIYYVRSADGGATWSAPMQMAHRLPEYTDVSWPYIAAADSTKLILIYQAGARSVGRYQRTSMDGGVTWSEPRLIIDEMEGINGYVIPIADSAGQLHLIINMRTVATQEVGIYYSSWTGDSWSPVVPLVTDVPAADSAHFTAATIARGNEIHVVWNQLHLGEIWHLRGVIQNVAPAQGEPVPASASAPSEAAIANKVATLPAQHIVANVNPLSPTPVSTSAGNSPLIPGVIGALIVIVAIAVARSARRFR
jgi:hypothetical protein